MVLGLLAFRVLGPWGPMLWGLMLEGSWFPTFRVFWVPWAFRL